LFILSAVRISHT